MSLTLYQLTVEGMELERILIETEGELTPELEARFDEMLRGGSDKIHAAVSVKRKIEADAALCLAEASVYQAEVDRLKAKAKAHEKNAEALSARIVIAMDTVFGGKLKSATMTIWTQKAADKVDISFAADVDPAKMALDNPTLVRTTYAIDNTAVKNHKKLTDSYPAEFDVKETPGKRFLQAR